MKYSILNLQPINVCLLENVEGKLNGKVCLFLIESITKF